MRRFARRIACFIEAPPGYLDELFASGFDPAVLSIMTFQAFAGRLATLSRACPFSPTTSALHFHSVNHNRAQKFYRKQAFGLSAPVSGIQLNRRALRTSAMTASASLVDQIKEKNEKYPVIMYSKTYCPYCGQVKGLFKKLNVDFTAVDLDEIVEGSDIQDSLVDITGSHTVPQVFIKGQYIGGCDSTMKKHNNGELKKLFEEGGINSSY